MTRKAGQNPNAVEIDLHDMIGDKAIAHFVDFYNARVGQRKLDRITVIHGYGSNGQGDATIKNRLRQFLDAYPQQVGYQRGDDIPPYNPGITFVTPRLRLPANSKAPPQQDMKITQDLVKFCVQPKTMDKIRSKFFRRNVGIERLVESLVAEGRLARLRTEKEERFQATDQVAAHP